MMPQVIKALIAVEDQWRIQCSVVIYVFVRNLTSSSICLSTRILILIPLSQVRICGFPISKGHFFHLRESGVKYRERAFDSR